MGNEVVEVKIEYLVNDEKVKLTEGMVKQFITKGNAAISHEEAINFMSLCKFQKLNPFLNEVYLVKFKGSPAQNIVGKEAYMKRAESHPQYDGFKAGLILMRGDEVVEVEGAFALKTDDILGGWATVYRKDRTVPVTERVDIEEFDKGQSTWKKMQKLMIRKVAIVHAMREAFPKELGALYIEEEIKATADSEFEKGMNANSQPFTIDKEDVIEVEPVVEEPQEATDLFGNPVSDDFPDGTEK